MKKYITRLNTAELCVIDEYTIRANTLGERDGHNSIVPELLRVIKWYATLMRS